MSGTLSGLGFTNKALHDTPTAKSVNHYC